MNGVYYPNMERRIRMFLPEGPSAPQCELCGAPTVVPAPVVHSTIVCPRCFTVYTGEEVGPVIRALIREYQGGV